MFVWAVADRALDMIGLGTVIYWTVKFTLWISRRVRVKDTRKPRVERL